MKRQFMTALGGLTFLLASFISGQPKAHGADASGQQLFNNSCRTCHTTKEGDNRFGPHLHNIIGRKAGSLPNYRYSEAMQSADFVWDEDKLGRFIENPDALVPGNRMTPYTGVRSAEDKAKIIAFLKSSGQ
ncbi:c-type cytochrome [Bradyrhizobium neotropicale]|uniref:c-type cytochrome n=1 Tax=Bradyrhizobium neotropicale TaxID=1497615 RepID=UPI001AD7D602|nr:c-type cytochrome [Bradyrhizobium neotropicale]MBO4227185.1 c-type cytochrome [Bradyrhizobium neotropicale]